MTPAANASPALPAVGPDALAGRVILVTGAYGGLGEAVSLACARAGATVVLLGRKVPKLSRTYDAVKAVGPLPALYPLDLAGADPADYETMADTIAADLGGLHGIVHCGAEFSGLRPLEATPPEDFLRALHVNLTAPWLLTQACLPQLRKAPDSAVVFVLEDLARVNRAYWGAYGIAKAGMDGMFRMLHDETENSAVRVSALRPRPMRTTIPSRAYIEDAASRLPSPARYAGACAYLLSPEGAALRGQVLSDLDAAP